MSSSVGLRALAVLISVAMVTSAAPMLISSVSPVENVSAQEGGYVHVGWMQKFQNWNPLNIELVSDWVATFLVYSSLFQYDETYNKTENHLALDYTQVIWPSGNMSTYVNITHNAYFRNRDNPTDTSHKLTAHDVNYTIELIQNNPGGSWDYYVANITGAYVLNDYLIKLDTDYPKATMIDDLAWVPIVPEFWWSDKNNVNPNNVLANLDPYELLGSGPFFVEEYDHNQWYRFKTAPRETYHCTVDYGEARDIDFEGILYTIYSSTDGLKLAIENGAEDAIDITGCPGQTWDSLGAGMSHIEKLVTTELGIYDICINGIPLELREPKYGQGNVILLDKTVRKALGMTLNRDSLKYNYFDGRPTIADTVLNNGTFWHADLESYTEVLPYDPAAARAMLIAAGYEDTDGDPDHILQVTAASEAIDYGAEIGDPLEFRLRVPDSDPGYKTVGEAWVGWAKEAGIKLNFEEVQEALMINFDWYQADFDIWVWSWYWGSEPLSNLAVWRTSEVRVGGDNCAGPIGEWWWVDEENRIARSEYDDVFDEALRTTDINQRKVLVDELQTMIYNSYTEFPPLHPNGLYAVSTANYVGWGDWENNLGLTIISDMLWVWYNLEPTSTNENPEFNTPLNPAYEVEVNEPATFSVGVSDEEGDPITVTWCWGDDTDNETVTIEEDTEVEQTVTASHTYTATGDYELVVSIIDDQHTVPRGDVATVTVLTEMNLGPDLGPVTVDPSVAYVDEEVTWTAIAKDAEQGVDGEGLLFTWEWGDDSDPTVELVYPVENDTEVSSVQTHAWSDPGNYYVTVSVWDGFDVDTNSLHNVSITKLYEVILNTAPTILNLSAISGIEGVEVPCVVTMVDADPDTLTITWEWDDGTYSVSTFDTSDCQGEQVRIVANHTWSTAGTYPVTVHVDDGYLEEDHNVSASVDAEILLASDDAPPGSISLCVKPYPSYEGDLLAMNITAYDANGDAMTVTIDFGDDAPLEVATVEGGEAVLQWVEFMHVYETAGTYTVTVYVDDGATNVSEIFIVEVLTPVANREPILSLATSYSFYLAVEKKITPDVYDPDGDSLTVWYDWGDDSPLTKGDEADRYAASHTYLEAGTFTLKVSANDSHEHNVTAQSTVDVQEDNRRPRVVSVVKVPTKESYEIGETITFNVTVYDREGDDVTIVIDFGDDTNQTLEITDLLPMTNRTVSFTHEYAEAGAYTVVAVAKDGYAHADPTWLSASTVVNVEAEDEGGISALVIAGIVLAIIIILVVVLMLMRKKKGGAVDEGGMEGMAPPEKAEQAPPPSPPETGG
jgi:ABC-type transport system substrate-binding protein